MFSLLLRDSEPEYCPLGCSGGKLSCLRPHLSILTCTPNECFKLYMISRHKGPEYSKEMMNQEGENCIVDVFQGPGKNLMEH